jgi:hypothetical protein
MASAELEAQLQQLQDQQGIFTAAVKAMLEGNWCGEGSAQALLLALDPSLGGECKTPIRVSDVPAVPPRAYDPNVSQPGQLYDWTCSCCSTDWLLRAYGCGFNADDIYASREQTTYAIGYTGNVNSTYGLMDGSGAQLQRVLREQGGLDTRQGWIDFDTAYAIFSHGKGGVMSGGNWYHWVGVRGVDGPNLWIANSAPGYKGVWDILDRASFNALGPFSVVAVV